MLSNLSCITSRDSMLLNVLNVLPVAAVIRDDADTVRYWNAGAAALYGWAADEAVGRPSIKLFDTRPALVRKSNGTRGYLLRPSPDLVSRLIRNGQRVIVHRRAVCLGDEVSPPTPRIEVELSWPSPQVDAADAARAERKPAHEKLQEKLRELKVANAALAAENRALRAAAQRDLDGERRRAKLAVQQQEQLRNRLAAILQLATQRPPLA